MWLCCYGDSCSSHQGVLSDSEGETASSDLKDLEFKLLHDMSQLQVRERGRKGAIMASSLLFIVRFCAKDDQKRKWVES